MPLPPNGAPWPPAPLTKASALMAEHAAWWTGDTAGLERTYQAQTHTYRPSQYAGGIVGAVSRFW